MKRRVNNDQNSTVERVSNYCFISLLPFQLLHDICFRLPIKDVVRCKSVCTEWNNLLSIPRFSEEYAKFSPFTSLLHCIDRATVRPNPRVMDLVEFSENGDSVRSRITLRLPQRLQRTSLFFLGSCNGLLCIELYVDGCHVIYVTNPILGYGIELPRDYTPPRGRHVDQFKFGLNSQFKFGFSSTTKKFKVLKISYESKSDCGTGECEILTVGVDDKWRRLPNSFPKIPSCSDFVALDGIFHWIRTDKGPDFICTFDLGEEKCGQISLPPSLLLVSKPVHMAVSRKQLCFVDSSVQSQVSLWTLRKNPGGESWTKIVIFDSWLTSRVYIPTPYLIPDEEVQSGDMLFQYTSDYLISYNVEQKRCSEIKFKAIGGFPSPFVLGYSPSFSLPAGIKMEKGQVRSDVVMKERRRSTRIFSKSRLQ